MPNDVSWNNSLKANNHYGQGVIQNTAMPNLNQASMVYGNGIISQSCDKDVIRHHPSTKHIKGAPNHFTNYSNDPVSKPNLEERQDEHLNTGLDFLQMVENSNFDFDGDGSPDLDLNNYNLPMNKKEEEKQEQQQEVLEDPVKNPAEQKIEEKPVNVVHTETVQKQSEEQALGVLKHLNRQDKTETPVNKLKEHSNAPTDSMIRSTDALQIGMGALALAMIFTGRG